MFDLDHRRMRRRVEAYVDGYVAPTDDASVVEAHLAECAMCRTDVEVLRHLKQSLERIARRQATDLSVARVRRWLRRQLR